MTVTMRAELFEQMPTADQWHPVALSEVEDGDVVSLDLAALSERRRESVRRVDWTEVYADAHAVAVAEDLGGAVRLNFYDLTHPTVVGVPEMQVLRLR
ncbi:hypothetical protein [Verrucosispora sp. WMMD1129]|uniref:hypothetical protein n=1 Tax=Verrucosispora sp. WMMD1129 TaxID=3016093 RepID=UPI00249BBC58|nr:hypothetical protein [Verrucosispora sp. WMMD1129]WFE47613.1 hypothetical protein O7624_26470 [Verrucosispora sp. WMMD1129]